MAKRTSVRVEQVVAAPLEKVWRLATEVEDWPRWSAYSEAKVEVPGRDGPGSAGEVRSLRWRGGTTREEITESHAPRHYAYRLLQGPPLRDYRADVTLEPAGAGTKLTWHSSFENRIPGSGPLNAWFLRRFLRRLLSDLKAEAEREPPRLPAAAGSSPG